MGMFVNPDNSAFQVALNSEIYVDKTGLNEEIRQELTNAVESKHWDEMLTFQQESGCLLNATLEMYEKD